MKLNSIKFKICVVYVAILGVVLVAYRLALYFNLYHALYKNIDNELRIKAQGITDKILSKTLAGGESDQDLSQAIQEGADVLNMDHDESARWKMILHTEAQVESEYYFTLFNPRGVLIAKSTNITDNLLSSLRQNYPAGNIKKLAPLDIRKDKIRLLNYPFLYKDHPGYILQIGVSTEFASNILSTRRRDFFISIPIILLIASLLGNFFIRRILNPALAITTTARNISYKNLDERVQVEHLDVEMKYLADAFNDMLNRLQNSFQYITDFSSYSAHELKTPLAIIKGESEIALQNERGKDEYKRVIKANLDEVDRLLHTIDSLLLLAKLDFRPEALRFERFNLSELLSEVYEQGKILAAGKNISIILHMSKEALSIKADKVMLRRLFFNLIDNAIKYNGQDGNVEITVKQDTRKVTIAVTDTGVGIAREELGQIFKRFYRSRKNLQRDVPGSGLGLSIIKSIVKTHQGDITVESESGKGSTFTVILPLT